MKILVQKYGGTSLASPQRIQAVAKRVVDAFSKERMPMVVVVSAMGDTTDDLIQLSSQISSTPNLREYDALIATGEMVSAALLSMAIHALGVSAVSLTGTQAGIKTENIHSKAKIVHIDISRLRKELDQGNVVVVTGFQGFNDVQDVVTIGRGGSDTSAVALAAALGAPVCEIYTDVEGIYTTDPRLVKDASKLRDITYDEMLELAALGAKVLHPRSVECAKENGIIIHVRSSFSPNEGTFVKETSTMEAKRPITGATLSEEEAIVSISQIPDTPGVASIIFSHLAQILVNVDMIVQSASENGTTTISFTIHQDELPHAEAGIREVAGLLNAGEVRIDRDVAKVSIVGVGMISKPGIAAKMFDIFASHGVNIKVISTSEIKISCAISRRDGRKILQDIHAQFGLDNLQ